MVFSFKQCINNFCYVYFDVYRNPSLEGKCLKSSQRYYVTELYCFHFRNSLATL